MGRLLREEDMVPDHIVSSTAARARGTAAAVARASGFDGEIEATRELYLSGLERHLGVVQALAGAHDVAMIVGHNPDLEDLVEVLVGRRERMPTAALARVELPVPAWGALRAGGPATLVKVWRPKELARADR